MPQRTFAELVEAMRGFQESRALLSAVELDLFTAVGEGAGIGEIAARIGAPERSAAMLADAMAACGALVKSGGVYRNTPETARFLTSASPESQRAALMHTVHMWRSWSTLTEAVRAGTAVLPPGVEAEDPAWTGAFIAAMHRNAAAAAVETVSLVGAEGVGRMLDVGGGSGAYSIAFARANPELRAEVFDRAPVLPIARRHIEEAGLAARVTTREGDLTADEFGAGYNLLLLSAICHMLSPDENRSLLGRCRRALAPGGRVAIRDFILRADRTAPKPAALFALNMLVATRGGNSYTGEEYAQWLAEAGFTRIERPRPEGDILVAVRP